MSNEINFSGIWIPRFVLVDENLSRNEMFVLSTIYTLSEQGGCFASNEYFANMLKMETRSIANIISKLKNRGYIIVNLEKNGAIVGSRVIIPNQFYSNKEQLPKNKKETKRFTKPTVQEIREYVDELAGSTDAERFYDHYESNGWKVGGKSPMKDWKATVRNWEKNNKERVHQQPKKNLNFDDLQYDENDNFKGVW